MRAKRGSGMFVRRMKEALAPLLFFFLSFLLRHFIENPSLYRDVEKLFVQLKFGRLKNRRRYHLQPFLAGESSARSYKTLSPAGFSVLPGGQPGTSAASARSDRKPGRVLASGGLG